MGTGLIIILLSILLYTPILIWSVTNYLRTTKSYKQESENDTSPRAIKIIIILLYVIAVLSNKNFGAVIMHAIQHFFNQEWHWLEYWLKHDIKRALLAWDDWGYIAYYYLSILIAYASGFILAYLIENKSDSTLQKYNTKKLATVILLIQPFIIISMLGRLLDWEQMANSWLGL